jgi:hypothetical protein
MKVPKGYIIVEPRRKNKKYSVLKWDNIKNDYKYLLSFGELQNKDGDFYQHYKDSTPLKLYSDLDHKDPERRKRYYLRHSTTDNIDSAKWFSNNFLW